MQEIEIINLENAGQDEVEKYDIRKAARAVIFDENNLLGLIYSSVKNYYTLPGGGVEENENIEDAVKRECKEEAGCDVEIVKEAGFVTEYRKKGNLKQTSYYYIVKVVGKKGTPNLTEDEIAEGYEIVWVPFETALEKVKANNATFYSAPYIKARDLGALKTLGKK